VGDECVGFEGRAGCHCALEVLIAAWLFSSIAIRVCLVVTAAILIGLSSSPLKQQ
jgi:hypothetical protein